MPKEKIFCANCQNCIVIRQYESEPDRYVLRVKCLKKKWVKRSGEEKLYKRFRILGGLYGFERLGKRKRIRILWIPFGRRLDRSAKKPAKEPAKETAK